MDFFERQDRARRNTKLLVVYFVIAVMCIVLAVYLASLLIFAGTQSRPDRYYDQNIQFALWNPQIFLGALIGTLGVIAGGSLYQIAALAQGGSAVAELLGGRPVAPNTTHPDERKLLNVVEEMAVASGVPAPQVYVLDDESSINAFAAGYSTSDAVVAVTRGGMTLLTRDELQGVIGHEFSHILNGDMRLNLRLMGLIFGILCLATIGRILLRTRGRKNPLPLLGLALLAIGAVGVFFGRLIQAAVSRQREFLADASSVQFTRNPAGLSGALQKIGGLANGSQIRSDHAADACHLFFGNALGQPLFGVFATHPPLDERIRAIDPGWDGTFPNVASPLQERLEREISPRTAERCVPPPRLEELLGGRAAAGLAPAVIRAEAIIPQVGAPATRHLEFAAGLKAALPEKLSLAARDPMSASALIYGLLLSPDEAMRASQFQQLAQRVPVGVQPEIARLLPDIAILPTGARLPLVDLILPTLRRLSPVQYRQFTAALQFIIESDRQIDLFEYMLQKMVQRHLASQFLGARPPIIQYYSLKPLASDVSVLLSSLACAGQNDPARIQNAFRGGAFQLEALRDTLTLLPPGQCHLAQVDAALNRLALAAPQIKKSVLNACALAVATDGFVQIEEAELLRAIADTLDCPLPPFVAA